MSNDVSRKGTRASAIFATLLTVFLVFGVASATVAGANDGDNEGTQTESPSPSVTTTTTTPAPTATESPSPTATSDDEVANDGEATHTESDAVDGRHSGDGTTSDVHAGIHVTVSADTETIAAAGTDVTFTFVVQNTSGAQLEITALSDDVFGTLTGDADCHVGTMLNAGGSCSFTLVKHLSGVVGAHLVNVFTASGSVEGKVVSDVDSVVCLVVSAGQDVTGDIHVTKTADVDAILASGGEVTFTFTVQNTSDAQLEITLLSDDVFGTLSGDADCQVGTILAAGADCSFTLTKHLSGAVGTHHVNVFTASGEVNGKTVTNVASETVLFVSAGEQEQTGSIHVTKTADVDSVVATGGDVTFTYTVENTSKAQLEITVLSDDVFGTLSGDADCQVGTVLPAGVSCSFTLTEHLSGAVGTHHVNVFTASGEVNGKTVTNVASETVLFVSANSGGTGGGGTGGGGQAGSGGAGGANVLGAQVTRSPGSAANSGGLAFTGSTTVILAAAALGLFALGLTVLTVGRKLGKVRG